MRIAHFDCYSGASGNMILGALVDAGLDRERLESGLRRMELLGWRMVTQRVRRGTIDALHLDFECDGHAEPRGLREIEQIIRRGGYTIPVESRAVRMFERLAVAEARVHGVAVDQIHFHEVGAVDSILDIVGAAIAFDTLGIVHASASRINVGGGTVRSQHGVLPVPAPATVCLLEGTGAITYSDTDRAELLTPTGALVLTEFATTFGTAPELRITQHGYGAGTKEFEAPNVLRVVLGDASGSHATEPAIVIETNIDDMNPEHYPYVSDRLFAAGALDVSTSPIGMKKGRPGVLVRVVARPSSESVITSILLEETTTLGVRTHDVRRSVLQRHVFTVDTSYGPIAVKASYVDGQFRDVAPEADSCASAARAHGVPLRDVYDAARSLGRASAPAAPSEEKDAT